MSVLSCYLHAYLCFDESLSPLPQPQQLHFISHLARPTTCTPRIQNAHHSWKMASQLAEHAKKKRQPSVELVSPTDIRDSNVQASDADTTMDPEHKSLAKEKTEKKAEKEATPTSFFGRILGLAYSWLTSGRVDQGDDSTKSPNDNEATGDFFQVLADFKRGRHEYYSPSRPEDAEAAS
jgi:hypothetical protein